MRIYLRGLRDEKPAPKPDIDDLIFGSAEPRPSER